MQLAPGGLEGASEGGTAHPAALADRHDMEVYAEASEEEVRAAIGKLSDAMGGTG
ncbi:hypothetical protein GCM10010365_50790 [Streptomyces poonensis]|uniref:Uncharacterized protein n=1 Tax=Streptomyces poonensis TaxID=68255 RepID=A0A918UPC2_9ACTN|nr:hypothetical protein GCM10010365_50790 [Streptomyces poonensis]GLJ89965.1 hypothetical protein GCM10017589_25660 [Streptomyces poonensis]